MLNILLVTHQHLAQSLLNIVNSMYYNLNISKIINIKYIELDLDFKPHQEEFSLYSAQKMIDGFTNKNTILITDLYGSSPYNLALKLAKTNSAYLLAGINLPMLIKIINLAKNASLDNNFVKNIVDSAQSGIIYQDFSKKPTLPRTNIFVKEPELS